MDERYCQYAQLILRHSLGLQPGEQVLIQCDPISFAFAEVIAVEVIRAGGHPVFWCQSPRAGATRLNEGTDEQVSFIHPSEMAFAECDCWICIHAPHNWGFDHQPDRESLRRRAQAELRNRLDRLRWVLALQPTAYLAERLGVSFSECEDLVLSASIDANWNEIAQSARAVGDLFSGGSEIRIVAAGTDLRFQITGRPWAVGVGENNLPDGEVFTAPVHETVEGTVYFPDPQVTKAGRVASEIRLTFRNGRVVEATAESGLEVLTAALDTDEGARCLGEFGIGVNQLIRQQTGDILLDEKIGGTIHLALGNAYPFTGGTNQSLVHWDLILDLRKGGTVYLDGREACVNGRWLLPVPR